MRSHKTNKGYSIVAFAWSMEVIQKKAKKNDLFNNRRSWKKESPGEKISQKFWTRVFPRTSAKDFSRHVVN